MGWKDFIKRSDEELLHLKSYPVFELEAKISIFMDEARQFQTNLKIGAIIDCFFNLYMFAAENHLLDLELLFLLKLQSQLLSNCEKNASLVDNVALFRDAFRESKINLSKSFADPVSCKKIIDYMLQTFFQHHYLYYYIFHHYQVEEELNNEIFLEVLPPTHPYPPPLEEGISKEWYDLYLERKEDAVEEKVGVPVETDGENALICGNEDINETCNEDNIDAVVSTLSQDEIKLLIKEAAEKKFLSVKMELETKIKEKESALVKNLNKMQAL